MFQTARRLLIMAAGLAVMSSMASGYYYWVFFNGRTGPFAPVMARFDLNGLRDNSVSYFISDQGPGPLLAGDGPAAVYSQIRAAANTWNSVGTSAIRLRFGGFETIGTPQSSSGIDVVFDDNMPPGLMAQTRLTLPADLSFVANGASFVPILRSKVQLRHDFTAAGYQQAAYYDSFFTTLVHEFGHSLGLQHTLTSGVMSTSITRATTKAVPLSADDMAGISNLYPAPGYGATLGNMAGQVTLSGSGLNLASVVALSPTTGVAISGLTNPDGTYTIRGIPPGQYYVYAHPLPPAQVGEVAPDNVVPPSDLSGNPFPANIGFDTEFFPGTKDWTQAIQVGVIAGDWTTGVNFAMQPRTAPVLYNMQTYGYPGGSQLGVPAPPAQSGVPEFMTFTAVGSTINNQTAMAPGLAVSAIGNVAQVAYLQYYSLFDGYGYLQMWAYPNTVTTPTPVALALTLNNELYVLPGALTVVPNAPPVISSVTPGTDAGGNLIASIAGSNLSASSKIMFDGAAAVHSVANADGSLTVYPPPATSGYQAKVEALNADTQTSSQALVPAVPPVFSYPQRNQPSIALSTSTVAAGTDAMIIINGVNTNFTPGSTSVGFGSSDITVRRIWVVNTNLIEVNISVNATAGAGVSSDVTVATGLETVMVPAGIQVTASPAPLTSIQVPVVNAANGLAGIPSGGIAVFNTIGLAPLDLTGWTLLIGGQNAPFVKDQYGQIRAVVPLGLPTGPETVQLIAPGGGGPPAVLMQLDAPAPVIVSAFDNSAAAGAGAAVSSSTAANPGDTVTLTVSGLADSYGLPVASAVSINAGGILLAPSSIVTSGPNTASVQFVLPANIPASANTAVTIQAGTRLSLPFELPTAAVSPAPSGSATH